MLDKHHKGFTLIELMVSMVIGLFLLGGVMTIFLNGRDSQRVVDEDVRMMDNARFALETIAYDLRHAGLYGQLNHEYKDMVFDEELFTTVTGQCGTGGWVVDLDRPVVAVNDATDYAANCMADWALGDTLEVRYSSPLPAATVEADLIGNVMYIKSNAERAIMLVPDVASVELLATTSSTRYFQWHSRGYFISDHTETSGDGVPSLRLVSVEPGPVVNEEVLLKGVEDMQIQFGLDVPLPGDSQGDESADAYRHPAAGLMWNQVIAARIWLVVRSEKTFEEAQSQTFEVAGVSKTFNDNYKRIVVSTTVRLRNINTGY